jgi:hypothetical protein
MCDVLVFLYSRPVRTILLFHSYRPSIFDEKSYKRNDDSLQMNEMKTTSYSKYELGNPGETAQLPNPDNSSCRHPTVMCPVTSQSRRYQEGCTVTFSHSVNHFVPSSFHSDDKF